MKASMFLRIYEKDDLLPNVLYSIARQKVPFDLEICICIDGDSHDPEPLVKEYLPDAKIFRFKRCGAQAMNAHCLDIISPDSDIIIIQSCDVMHCYDNTIEELCMGVGKKVMCSAEVRDMKVNPYLYKDYENGINELMENGWNTGKVKAGIVPKRRRAFFWFLAAIGRKDFEDLNLSNEAWCDSIVTPKLMDMGFDSYFPSGIKGMHQSHDVNISPCPLMVKECGKIQHPDIYGTCKVASYFRNIGIITENDYEQFIKDGGKPICVKKI